MVKTRANRNNPDELTLQQAFETLRVDYNAAKPNRYRRRRPGVAGTPYDADYHYRNDRDLFTIQEQARDMDRNDAVLGMAIDRLVNNILLGGMKIDPETPDEKLNAELAARWKAWAEDPRECDTAREHTFSELEYFALREAFVDGDTLTLGTEDGPLELVEAHRLRSPRNRTRKIVHGVELSASRQRMAYWIAPDHLDPMSPPPPQKDFVRVLATDQVAGYELPIVYHVLPTKKRITQTRGVSALCPIIDLLSMFEDVNFAKLVQAQIVSCFAVFFERKSEFNADGGAITTGATTTETDADGSTRTIQGISPGMRVHGAPGEEIKGFSPNVPNPEFFPHAKMILQLISTNLGLPLIVLLMDASETNFSGWRGAFEIAKFGFRWFQRHLCTRWHAPIYRWKVAQWAMEDASLRTRLEQKPEELFLHRWSPPQWPYIQPLDEAKADALRIKERLTSPRRSAAGRGQDYREIANETVADNRLIVEMAAAAAEELNKAHPEAQVDWRELANFTSQPAGAEQVTEDLVRPGVKP